MLLVQVYLIWDVEKEGIYRNGNKQEFVEWSV